MRGIIVNRLRQCSLFIGLIFLFILPSDEHAHSIKADIEKHLNLLFEKYKNGDTIPDYDLHHLISKLRKPEKQCFDAMDIVNGSLDKETLRKILPTLVFDLVEHNCSGNLSINTPKPTNEKWKVWTASICAVLVISFSGLVVVGLVPMMSRKIYNVVTQFLIALSVGSLIGDAFLHLIPHALLSDGFSSHGHSHESSENGDDQHDTYVWKAIIVIVGVYAFFLTERITIIGQNHASMRKLKRTEKLKSLPSNSLENGKKPIANGGAALTHLSSDPTSPSSQDGKKEPFVDLNQRTPGENPCTNRIGVDEITCQLDERPPNGTRHLCNRPPSRPLDNARCSEFLANEQGANINGVTNNDDSEEEDESQKHVKFDGDYLNNDDEGDSGSESGDDADDCDDEANKKADKAIQGGHGHHMHGHGHHHHGHGHGHSHHGHRHGHARRAPLHPSKPHGHHHGHSHDLSSVKAIAWTIIAGDGLHNFCDGIAIGASFADDLNGGFSTALAVLCHELPHELGDFAVLLHAGMSMKAALFYNSLSSILCAAGMVVGVLLGSMSAVNIWLFLLTAGMFVYIALVDMMPELTTSRMHGYRTCHMPTVLFFWQNVGMIIGVVIMLFIAKFEKHISKTF